MFGVMQLHSCKHIQTLNCQKKTPFCDVDTPSMTTMEPTTNTTKQVSKMMEREKAALEEQCDGLKKHKNDGGDTNVSKRGHTDPEISHNKNSNGQALNSSQGSNPSRRATAEDIPDDDGFISQCSDKNESCTIEETPSQPCAEKEPGVLNNHAHIMNLHSKLAVQKNERNSPIYAFFENPKVIEQGSHPVHEFKCSRRGCAGRVRCYLDTKDAGSTGNL